MEIEKLERGLDTRESVIVQRAKTNVEVGERGGAVEKGAASVCGEGSGGEVESPKLWDRG